MPCKLVHNYGVLRLVEGAGDLLNEKTECLLVLLCCHEGLEEAVVATTRSRGDRPFKGKKPIKAYVQVLITRSPKFNDHL